LNLSERGFSLVALRSSDLFCPLGDFNSVFVSVRLVCCVVLLRGPEQIIMDSQKPNLVLNFIWDIKFTRLPAEFKHINKQRKQN
jgi:hypothetical protein